MKAKIEALIFEQDTAFENNGSLPVSQRKQLLKSLLKVIQQKEDVIVNALYKDFKKPAFETSITEVNLVISEIYNALNHIDKWSRPKRITSSLLNFPATAKIYREPYGRVLIISPWNYPFSLAMTPLIGAVAAGNTAVLKPSELSPNTAKILEEIIIEVFSSEQVAVILGDRQVAQLLLDCSWDYIFFTGSTRVGKYVYQKAAEHLTPVTLELGGKSPCIVDYKTPLQQTAKRIVWGKFLNAGQSCIAPDYLLVHHQVKDQMVAALIQAITSAYSIQPEHSDDYARVLNASHADRLFKALKGQKILWGGTSNGNFFTPTIVDEPDLESDLMQQEIFGPILPIISYQSFDQIQHTISQYEKPLALYVFSDRESFTQKILKQFSFGGGVVNDTMVHYINKKLPFGGVGHSGMGAYHGAYTFMTFSRPKPVVQRGQWIDIPLRYPPYKSKAKWLKLIQKLL